MINRKEIQEATKEIKSVQQIPLAFAFYMWEQGMSRKEKKSFAKCIGYPYGIFQFKNKVRIQLELGILYAFLGSNLLREHLSFIENKEITDETIDSLIITFENKFFNCFVHKLVLPGFRRTYIERKEIWNKIKVFPMLPYFSNDKDIEIWYQQLKLLALSFYQYITEKDEFPDEMTEWVLTERIRNYIKLFNSSLENMLF